MLGFWWDITEEGAGGLHVCMADVAVVVVVIDIIMMAMHMRLELTFVSNAPYTMLSRSPEVRSCCCF